MACIATLSQEQSSLQYQYTMLVEIRWLGEHFETCLYLPIEIKAEE